MKAVLDRASPKGGASAGTVSRCPLVGALGAVWFDAPLSFFGACMTARDRLAQQFDELRDRVRALSTVMSWPGLPQVGLVADIDLTGASC